ncbi:Fur family transcriptional regulator [Anaeromyxobacter oryzae]|uniref:Ferric uptake regulation protein n=1 Tax=Anaeromyxobacter oryzae TaxID=2918170 RepID=A0ABN6N1I4_9BACT|nr:transcriptional repressor [Anaeromyxobacter oryzae]BDG06415.1 transcriptional repressor [Anaeromyxobacter oryzae]
MAATGRGGAEHDETASPSARLGAYIEERGLKHSRQRERIAQTFFDMGGHVTVEQLVVRCRRDDARISVATVYRTMKLLAECGLASARQFGDGQTRYEPAAGRAHHDHLICTSCGEIVEFANERIETLQALVARRHGFEVESHRLELYGRCARCKAARPREVRP